MEHNTDDMFSSKFTFAYLGNSSWSCVSDVQSLHTFPGENKKRTLFSDMDPEPVKTERLMLDSSFQGKMTALH